MKKSDIFWQTYLNLEKEAIEVSKYIFFTDELLVNSIDGIVAQSCNKQLETFSPYIADLLVRCCVQIEVISKELYFDNNGTKLRGKDRVAFHYLNRRQAKKRIGKIGQQAVYRY